MSHLAIIAPAKVRAHPNADRLKILILAGHQVVTNADIEEDQLMCFFPEGLALSHEFLYENSEYRENKGQNRDPNAFGYFDTNGRVRTIKLRGERSEVYAVSLDTLAWTGYNLEGFYAGMTFDQLNGHIVCKKYVSPATQRAIERAAKQGKKRRKDPSMFKQHFDTKKLRYNLQAIPDGARIILTEKMHGTSGRTGLVQVKVLVEDPPWYQRAAVWTYNLFMGKRGIVSFHDWQVVTGTRRVVLHNAEEGPNGYYEGMNFRHRSIPDYKHKRRRRQYRT